MKTNTSSLTGAVQRLLGTFVNPIALGRILVLGLACLVAVPVEAANHGGGGNGGGNGGNGGGGGSLDTIYYVGPWNTTNGGAVMRMMNSDGSNDTQLGWGLWGIPSRALHNGHRWFVTTGTIADQYDPDGTERVEIFALRDDFDLPTNDNASTRVQLTDDPTLTPWFADWVPGDEQISFIGRRWLSEMDATVVEGGLYTASLEFDADGNIIGLLTQPVSPAVPLPLTEPAACCDSRTGLLPDLRAYTWAPTADMVAYSNYADNELWVADLFNEQIRIYTGMAHAPQWSPDGSLIAFGDSWGISTIVPDGSVVNWILREKSGRFPFHAHWSTDGTFMVFVGQSDVDNNEDLFRASATGGKWTNLTGTAAPLQELMFEGNGGVR